MKTQQILHKTSQTLCTYKDECEFKKPTTTERTICTWKGHCNQQQTHATQLIQWNKPLMD